GYLRTISCRFPTFSFFQKHLRTLNCKYRLGRRPSGSGTDCRRVANTATSHFNQASIQTAIMPIPVPAGALREAHRVLCVRCLQHMTKHPDHLCEYDESSSKKCGYCTKQKARCVPVSVLNQARICIDNSQILWFCGLEFAEF